MSEVKLTEAPEAKGMTIDDIVMLVRLFTSAYPRKIVNTTEMWDQGSFPETALEKEGGE